MNASVFISYSRRNEKFARALYDSLTPTRNTWFDRVSISPGTDWWEEITLGIARSDNFLFIVSPSSTQSKMCGKELEHALALKKKIIPILYKPSPTTPAGLSGIQWIDFTGDFETARGLLDAALDTNLDDLASHTWLLQLAMRWQQQGKDASCLLRGKELATAVEWLSQTDDSPPHPTQLHREFILKSQSARVLCEKCRAVLS